MDQVQVEIKEKENKVTNRIVLLVFALILTFFTVLFFHVYVTRIFYNGTRNPIILVILTYLPILVILGAVLGYQILLRIHYPITIIRVFSDKIIFFHRYRYQTLFFSTISSISFVPDSYEMIIRSKGSKYVVNLTSSDDINLLGANELIKTFLKNNSID